MKRIAILLAVLLTCLSPITSRADAQEPGGSVVVARTHGEGVILWDISSLVPSLVAATGSSDDKVHGLEIDAAKILLKHLGEMSAASSVTVRVLYQKTGAVSPVYHTATFNGVETVLTVNATRSSAASNDAAWTATLARGVLPSQMHASVEGSLPPP